MEEWRTVLYPLGFISALAFGARFMIQWLVSEKAKKSVVPRIFWDLSLFGNLSLMVHSFIQSQAHVCIVQACSAVISWRNLNLMQGKKPPLSFKTVVVMLCGAAIIVAIALTVQAAFFNLDGGWFRIPTAPWQTKTEGSISFSWHAWGTLGYLLFSSRFWVQWWFSERSQVSLLPRSFWWLSLVGAVISIIYFIRIDDSVNLIGPLLGLAPYIRNLMLMYKTKEAT